MYYAKFYSKKKKNKNQTNVNVFCKPEEILSRQKKEKKKKKHKVEKDKKLAIRWRRATWRYAVCSLLPTSYFLLSFPPRGQNFVGLERILYTIFFPSCFIS